MKAVICTRYGGPEVLEIREIPPPAVGKQDVLVRVHAAPVNSADARSRGLKVSGLLKPMMRLALGLARPRQPVLGTVYAGVVEKVGASVREFKPGDAVFGCAPGLRFGCHAQYAAVPENSAIAKKPEGLPFEEAAALVFGGTCALYFLEKAAPKEGQSALIYGASGAVGTMAVQVAHNLGLRVTAAASGRNEELVRSLGASEFVDYTKAGFALPKGGFDIVFDAVGKLGAKQMRAALKPGGRYVTVGGLDTSKETAEQLERLAAWFREGKLKAVIEKTLPMERAAEAHALADSGRKRGSVVLIMD